MDGYLQVPTGVWRTTAVKGRNLLVQLGHIWEDRTMAAKNNMNLGLGRVQ
jgi:hypothetical protein